MPMTPERVAERVDMLIDAIRSASSDAFAEHNAAQTLQYIEQVYDMGIINAMQLHALVKAVNDAAHAWHPKVDQDGLPLDEDQRDGA